MKKHPWLDVLENLSLLGSGVGTVASIALNQSTYAIAPLSVAVALGAINRQRYQKKQDEDGTTLAELDQRLAQQVEGLNQQVAKLPSPETIERLKKSIIFKNRELAEHLYAEIGAVQEELQNRLLPLEQEGLSKLRQDVQLINEKYNHLSEGFAQLHRGLTQLSNSNAVSQLEGLTQHLQTEITTLQTNLEALTNQTKPNLNSLQDQIARLDRQFSKLPPPVDLTSLKREVVELVKMIGDLVHKRDFVGITQEVQELQQQQATLKQALESIETAAVNFKRTLNQLPKSQTQPTAADASAPTSADSSRELAPTVYPELQELASNYLTQVHSQLGGLRSLTSDLTLQQKHLHEQVNQLPGNLDVVAIQRQLSDLSKRIPDTETALKNFKSRVKRVIQQELEYINAQLQTLPRTPDYELIFDLGSVQSNPHYATQPAGSEAILQEALKSTQHRLIVIWPWSSQCQLDAALMQQFEAFLQQGKQLHIGWCQMADRDEDRLLGKLKRGWVSDGDRQNQLQDTLHQLLHLKRTFPDRFQFKILGTSENFLVSDSAFAVLGIADALRTFTTFPELQLKLKTRNADVIKQLIQRFDNPTLTDEDITAYWNRAVTRQDLGDKAGAIADYTHILSLHTDDAIAYNYRGLAFYETGNLDAALSNFTQSIRFNPHQAAAYCNRAFIRYEQGDWGGAISDYSHAIQMRSNRAIFYFYRAMVWQKLENYQEAVADYTEATYLAPDSALVRYYRGLAWQKLDNPAAAVADLEIAATLFSKQGKSTNAQKAQKILAKLRQQIEIPPSQRPANAQTDLSASANPNGTETLSSDTIMSFFQPVSVSASNSTNSTFNGTNGTLPAKNSAVKNSSLNGTANGTSNTIPHNANPSAPASRSPSAPLPSPADQSADTLDATILANLFAEFYLSSDQATPSSEEAAIDATTQASPEEIPPSHSSRAEEGDRFTSPADAPPPQGDAETISDLRDWF